MRYLVMLLVIHFFENTLLSQDLVLWGPSTNNLTQGMTLEHINIGVPATIDILNNGSDGISNIQVEIYNQNNDFQELVFWPTNISGIVDIGWKVVYVALSGNGNTCTNGGVDGFQIEDDLGNLYTNQNHCVKLPVTMPITYSKPLETTQKQNSTHLTWSVATQINNDKYIIEHSTDGNTFSTIGEIDGDGTNNAERHYEYTHKTPSIGVNYYRIKQIDYDGTSSYSNIASVVYESDDREIAIYPNPATDEVTLSVAEGTEVSVADMMGRVLKKVTIGKDQNIINLVEFPSGMLIFVIGDQRYRVLKE
jgi:hypothetical protein